MSGSLTLRVLATDQNVFDGSADEVILPSTTGQLGILPGHISLLTAIDVGVLRVRTNSGWSSIALMGGFAEVDADEVTVLVNGAELGSNIDGNSAEAEFQSASSAVAAVAAAEDGCSCTTAGTTTNSNSRHAIPGSTRLPSLTSCFGGTTPHRCCNGHG